MKSYQTMSVCNESPRSLPQVRRDPLQSGVYAADRVPPGGEEPAHLQRLLQDPQHGAGGQAKPEVRLRLVGRAPTECRTEHHTLHQGDSGCDRDPKLDATQLKVGQCSRKLSLVSLK